MPIVTKSSGNQAGLPKNAKIAQRLETIAWARRGTSVFPIYEIGAPSANVQGAAQAAASPDKITSGRIHGLANVVLLVYP